jgi:hypothetical protein
LFATKRFGKAVQYNDAIKANENVTCSLLFLLMFCAFSECQFLVTEHAKPLSSVDTLQAEYKDRR